MTDPFALFDAWYAEARETEINDSNAMALATAPVWARAGAVIANPAASATAAPAAIMSILRVIAGTTPGYSG